MQKEDKIVLLLAYLGVLIFTIIGIASAETIIAGESYSFESEQFDYFEIIGNSSSMEGMEISWDSGNTTISFDILFKPDSFTLIFWKDKEPIIEYRSSGSRRSSGTRTIYKDKEVIKIIEVPEYINQTIPCDTCDEPDKQEKSNLKINLFYILGTILLIIAIIWIVKDKKKSE